MPDAPTVAIVIWESVMEYSASVRLWGPIQSRERDRRYVAPLWHVLKAYNLGVIAGSSVQMSRELEVEFVEIDLILVNPDKTVDLLKRTLEEAGAPVGSEIRITRNEGEEVIRFGRKEGLAVYLDGVGLPDSVYETCSADWLAGLIFGTLTAVGGEIRSSWVGPNETAIYMYGPSAEEMYAALEPILAEYPLCRNARVVIRHGNPALEPRSVRLPLGV